MLEAARQNGVKKFVYASSSSVYGDEPNLPKTEGREGNLLSPYALTKRCDEEWAKLYTKFYGLDTYGMRYFNVFGRFNSGYIYFSGLWHDILSFLKKAIHCVGAYLRTEFAFERDAAGIFRRQTSFLCWEIARS